MSKRKQDSQPSVVMGVGLSTEIDSLIPDARGDRTSTSVSNQHDDQELDSAPLAVPISNDDQDEDVDSIVSEAPSMDWTEHDDTDGSESSHNMDMESSKRRRCCEVEVDGGTVTESSTSARVTSTPVELHPACRDQVAEMLAHASSQRQSASSSSSPQEESPVCCVCLSSLGGLDDEDTIQVTLQCGHRLHGLCLAPHVLAKIEQAKARMQETIRSRSAEVGLGGIARLTDGASLSSLHARGGVRQCPQCGYGPVLNTNCDSMGTHDATRGYGTGRTTNQCPNCTFYSENWRDWKVWDPEDVMASVRCPLCSGPCCLDKEHIPALKIKLAMVGEQASARQALLRQKQTALRQFGRDMCTIFGLVQARQNHGGESNSQPLRRFSPLPGYLADLAENVTTAREILEPMLEAFQNCQSIGSATLSVEPVQVVAEARDPQPSELAVLCKALADLSNLSEKEESMDRARKQQDFFRLMHIGENIQEDLNTICKDVVKQIPDINDVLRALPRTTSKAPWQGLESGFIDIPRLTDIVSALEMYLHNKCEQNPPSVSEIEVQTDPVSDEVGDAATSPSTQEANALVSVLSAGERAVAALADAGVACRRQRESLQVLRSLAEERLDALAFRRNGTRGGEELDFEHHHMEMFLDLDRPEMVVFELERLTRQADDAQLRARIRDLRNGVMRDIRDGSIRGRWRRRRGRARGEGDNRRERMMEEEMMMMEWRAHRRMHDEDDHRRHYMRRMMIEEMEEEEREIRMVEMHRVEARLMRMQAMEEYEDMLRQRDEEGRREVEPRMMDRLRLQMMEDMAMQEEMEAEMFLQRRQRQAEVEEELERQVQLQRNREVLPPAGGPVRTVHRTLARWLGGAGPQAQAQQEVPTPAEPADDADPRQLTEQPLTTEEEELADIIWESAKVMMRRLCSRADTVLSSASTSST